MDTKVCSKCGEEKALCEFSANKGGKHGRHSQCKECAKERSNKWYKENKERRLQKSKEWYENNKERKKETCRIYQRTDKYRARANQYRKQKLKDDPAFLMRMRISNHIYYALTRQGGSKETPSFEALPYTPQELKEHLENQFSSQMSWDNYGSYWEVDHIYPVSKLPHDSVKHPNFLKCWNLDNLQPLEKIANRRKSNKVLDG